MMLLMMLLILLLMRQIWYRFVLLRLRRRWRMTRRKGKMMQEVGQEVGQKVGQEVGREDMAFREEEHYMRVLTVPIPLMRSYSREEAQEAMVARAWAGLV
jgi:hypothetical protein